MTSVYEREFLYKDKDFRLDGFNQKPINRLVSAKPIPNILNIESNHLKRNFNKDIKDILPLLEYQLWLEAGKMDKANFKSVTADPSVTFDSNMWRNFRQASGISSNRKSTVSEAISEMYPINIPAPSQVGSNTLTSFYDQNRRSLFRSEKSFKSMSEKVDKEATIMKYLRLKSEMRNPPLDWNGNIIPPRNFVKYPPSAKRKLFAAVSNDSINYTHKQQQDDQHTLSPEFNAQNEKPSEGVVITKTRVPIKRFIRPSKLIFRNAHPNFEQVILEQKIKEIYKVANSNKNLI
jgi:hypothetical protein